MIAKRRKASFWGRMWNPLLYLIFIRSCHFLLLSVSEVQNSLNVAWFPRALPRQLLCIHRHNCSAVILWLDYHTVACSLLLHFLSCPGNSIYERTAVLSVCCSWRRGFPAPGKFTMNSLRPNKDSRKVGIKRGSHQVYSHYNHLAIYIWPPVGMQTGSFMYTVGGIKPGENPCHKISICLYTIAAISFIPILDYSFFCSGFLIRTCQFTSLLKFYNFRLLIAQFYCFQHCRLLFSPFPFIHFYSHFNGILRVWWAKCMCSVWLYFLSST